MTEEKEEVCSISIIYTPPLSATLCTVPPQGAYTLASAVNESTPASETETEMFSSETMLPASTSEKERSSGRAAGVSSVTRPRKKVLMALCGQNRLVSKMPAHRAHTATNSPKSSLLSKNFFSRGAGPRAPSSPSANAAPCSPPVASAAGAGLS